MKKDNDDIKRLFRSFGADEKAFQELARGADAAEAEARWPLLASVQPAKRDLPPLLTREEKQASWQAPEQHAQRAASHQAAQLSAGLGDKLSSSLKRQMAVQPARPLRPQPAPAAPGASARPTVSNRLNPPAPDRREPEKPKGLFSFAGEQSAASRNKADDALSSVFQRIDQQAEQPAAPVLRKGLLGRLGRP